MIKTNYQTLVDNNQYNLKVVLQEPSIQDHNNLIAIKSNQKTIKETN